MKEAEKSERERKTLHSGSGVKQHHPHLVQEASISVFRQWNFCLQKECSCGIKVVCMVLMWK